MNNMIKKIAKIKELYHKKASKLPFEEKYKIIIALQEIDMEFRRKNPSKKIRKYYRVWPS